MGEVIQFPTEYVKLTTEDLPVRKILLGADRSNLSETIVLGFDEKGELYFAASKGDVTCVLWLLEQAKHFLLNAPQSILKIEE